MCARANSRAPNEMRFISKRSTDSTAVGCPMTADNSNYKCIGRSSARRPVGSEQSLSTAGNCGQIFSVDKTNEISAAAMKTNANRARTSSHAIITDGAPAAVQHVQQPTIVRKTPKFPSRARHMAIRRKKSPTLPQHGSPVLTQCVEFK